MSVSQTRPPPDAERFRVRINVPRAWACRAGVVNPVANHEELLELMFALAGPGFQRTYDAFLESPEGRSLLDDRPDIVTALTDSDRLSECPPGSLGHAYHDFMAQNRLDAGLYDNTYHDLPAIADRLGWDEDFHYVVHRGIALHDLVHVLGGYGPDLGGEFGVLGFTHGQVGGWITAGGIALMMVTPVGVPFADRRRYWNEAVERGRTASLLFAAPYERWLDDPLDEVRGRLKIRDQAGAHPEGHMYSTYQFGNDDVRMMGEAFEPYSYDPNRASRS
jgi:ubiquinone biosynthesis protein COQ4